jgi:hypothetical protein
MPTEAELAALRDHNARVRRLARAYAPKYRPVVLVLGYAEDLSQPEGYTKLKVETIARKTARHTANKKPLSTSSVQKYLRELTKTEPSAALKVQATFGRNGHQGATVRYLNHHVAIDRHGFSVIHDWDAPLDQDCTGEPNSGTPGSTPVPPSVPPLSTVFDLASDLPPLLSPAARETRSNDDDQNQNHSQNQAPAGPLPSVADDDPSDEEISAWHTFYLWRAKSGNLAVFCAGDRGFSPRYVPKHAIKLLLNDEDGPWYYETWASWHGAGTVDDRARLLADNFCTDEQLRRLGLPSRIEAARAEAERQRMAAEAEAEAERLARAERKRAERDAAEAEFNALVPEFSSLAAEYSRHEPQAAPTLKSWEHPRRQVEKLAEQVAWYREALAARRERAPMAERALAYLAGHPDGALDEHIAVAAGIERRDTGTFVRLFEDLRASGRVRSEFTGRGRYMYYLVPDAA